MQKKYYGEQTQKAIKNFPFSVYPFHKEFIVALAQIKKAAAVANFQAGNFKRNIKDAIVKAADEIILGKHKDQFPLPALMGGAGTSIHMNVNEVIASRATEVLSNADKSARYTGKAKIVHPNDHVNRSQSTNDVNPSAIKVASVALLDQLSITLENLSAALQNKGVQFKNVIKLARTHLQDAVPITLGEEFFAYSEIIKRHQLEIKRVKSLALTLHLGGTAAGNSVNASPKYIKNVYKELNKVTKQKFRPAKNFLSHTSSHSDLLAISQAITALCMDLSKIATDLRLMSSGPRGGLGEISLAELQNGSSIMPGKVNPVLPETVNVLYYWVSGNNLTIEQAAHGANLDLAVMIPPIADRLIQSIKITAQVLDVFTRRCVVSIKANKQRCKELLENSTAYATLLTPVLGYEKMSAAVKEAVKTGKTLREVVVSQKLLSNKEFDASVNLFRA
jgi:aspartate ammonia-lyase